MGNIFVLFAPVALWANSKFEGSRIIRDISFMKILKAERGRLLRGWMIFVDTVFLVPFWRLTSVDYLSQSGITLPTRINSWESALPVRCCDDSM